MTNFTLDPEKLFAIKTWVTQQSPLIHCITNHISINDCANMVLAVGAKPIMAEHPAEVAEITATAKALAVNLGNITDTRMKSMLISGQTARSQQIPMIIDLVGVACSRLRLEFGKNFVAECRPQIIKGNISELRAFAGKASGAKGIDAGKTDLVTETTLASNMELLKSLALETGSVVLATGAVDLITDGVNAFKIQNGCEMLALITGTGCMLNVLTAAFIASQNILGGAILATAYMGICGELAAATAKGTGTFKTALLDSLFTLSVETFTAKLNCQAI